MTHRSRFGTLIVALALVLAMPATADVTSLQAHWAQAMYATPADEREDAMKALMAEAESEVRDHPDDPELLIWHGIILSSYAGEKGGLGALGLVKQARASLQRSLELDPTALDGSAHTSLGSLYYKVPGWPIGFGSDKQARQHLKAALAINPSGIDPNYFMGEFLLEEGDYESSRRYLETALEAPRRPARELADRGRRQEIRQLLARLDEHHP